MNWARSFYLRKRSSLYKQKRIVQSFKSLIEFNESASELIKSLDDFYDLIFIKSLTRDRDFCWSESHRFYNYVVNIISLQAGPNIEKGFPDFSCEKVLSKRSSTRKNSGK